ncbi:unnamed protein product [Ambrosiozyma monospora]|uniref:Unnamed protein product n=1 Tax=Ambrosiozyma monospora TaxID=43982 RepID=A0ACB5TAH8_AMBMO|nr:unnamed protein product [Ambrosiozyma monospora]
MSALRFFLGFVESGVTPALQHTLTMFFTPEEFAIVNPIFYISCMGIDIILSFISYGLQHAVYWRPWKWFWLIIAIISALCSFMCYFIYPDNPATSRLFTKEERIQIIKRIKRSTRSSIEQKTFKYYQFIECLKDPVSWLFMFFSFGDQLSNSTTYQSSIIYTSLGFSRLTTTLVMAVQNGFSTFCGIVGSLLLYFFKSQSFIVGALFAVPAFMGAIIAVSIDYDNKPGLLAGIMMTRSNGTFFIIGLGLCTATAGGYTKRLTRTLLFMIVYSVANIIAPQLWKPQYSPRYRISWIIQIVFSWFLAPLSLIVIRFILSSRNKRRLAAIGAPGDDDSIDSDEFGFVDVVDENGNIVKQKVDISMLDLTDHENKRFIYPL